MSRRPWYKRYGGDFVLGTMALSLEEKGAYSLCLDLIYDRGGPIPDDARWLAGMCGVSLRKWASLRERLIATGKLVEKGGHLTNGRAEREIAEAGEASRVHAENGAKGGRKRAENVSKPEDKSGETQGALNEINAVSQAGLKPNQKPEPESEDTPLPPKGVGRRKPEVPLPPECPSEALIDAMQAEARTDGRNIDMRREARAFRDWWTSKDGRHRDWDAAWRTWARKAIGRAPKTAVAAVAARTGEPDQMARWDSAVREFKANRYWPRDDLGPPPGREGCRAPETVLVRYGFIAPRPAANDADLFSREARG